MPIAYSDRSKIGTVAGPSSCIANCQYSVMYNSHIRLCYRRENRAMPHCRRKFRYVLNFTTASCGFSATARLSCIHQWPFKYWNYTQ